MALMSGCVETKPSSFEEAVQQPVWVDPMVEEYDSIVRNNVLDVVPRPEDKLVVSSRWIYKVKQAADGKHANEILRRFCMESSKAMETPLTGNSRKEDVTLEEVVEAIVYRQLVGSLMYLVNTRMTMCYVFNQLSQAMVKPTKLYWKATKHVLRCLKGITQYGLR
eukprot:PITA_33140